MRESTKQCLLLLAALQSLTGCAPELLVTERAPAPVFFSCTSLKYISRPDAPEELVNESVAITGVMLKLHDRQGEDEKVTFNRDCDISHSLSGHGQGVIPGKEPARTEKGN